MKNNTPLMRNSLSFTTVLVGAVVLSGFYLYNKTNTRQYHSGININANKEEGKEALGMMQYFFNARKSLVTGKMDYNDMATVNMAANKIEAAANNRNARLTSGLAMNWTPMGPSNIGGRTRGILIDNQDPTHNTIFAAAVSGGIWRSKDGAGTWDSVPGNDQLASLTACDIAQDKNGVLYVGTGEGFGLYALGDGFSTGMLGEGIFKSTDDGNTWTQMASTNPGNNNNNFGNGWSYVNRIAVDPNNPLNIYAGTHGGLMYSGDGGNTWSKMLNTAGAHPALGGDCLDVKISKDGSVMYAFAGNKLWYAYPNSVLITQMTQVIAHPLHAGGIYSGACTRMEISISPANPDYVYVSCIISGAGGLGVFGSGAPAGTGIYFTKTAKSSGNGGYWYNVGPGGSNSFDPYSSGGSQDQPAYDNAVGASASNPGEVLIGGTTLWKWAQANVSDTVGSWTNITTYQDFYQPIYIHPDEHCITFDLLNTNVVYDGNDGGIYKSVNGGNTWAPVNRNYNVTQFDAIAFAPNVSPVKAGYSVGEGVMGGTQDNGTPYINGMQYYYQDALEVGGGDGGMSYISQIDPNVDFWTSDNNSLFRGGSLSSAPYSAANLYTNTVGDTLGCNLDSMVTNGKGLGGCFYHQFAVYENSYDTTTNLDKMLWISDSNYSAGKIVYPISPNGNVPFPYKLKANVLMGDTLYIQNAVVSKLACGFSASNGVWLMMQAADVTDPPVWMPIGGPLSKPDAFSGADAVHSMAWSPDGDALFVGTEQGLLYRFSNLDSIVDIRYTTGALYGVKRGGGLAGNAKCRVISKHITTFPGGGNADVLSISIDPKNGNNMIVTLGNYVNGTHVYYCNNALSAAPTLTSAQGTGLPAMPIYSSLLNVLNSGQPNSAMVGTERGIYTTTNINAGSPTWALCTTGMPYTLVTGIRQQVMPPWNVNNSYNVYVGTHGRGAWVSTSFFQPLGVQPVVADVASVDMKVYPNPMTAEGTVEFTLTNETKNVAVTVFDINGRVVKTITLDNQAKGQHLVNINAEELSTGTYIACVTGEGFRKSTRFVVVR